MDAPRHKQGEMYDNETDRRNANLESKRRYAYKKWLCETCNVTVLRGNKPRHLKSQKHMRKECPTCSESED
jgi:transposase